MEYGVVLVTSHFRHLASAPKEVELPPSSSFPRREC
jgi:hypothetical protein